MLKLGNAEILRVEEMALRKPLGKLGVRPELVEHNLDRLIPHFLNPEDQTYWFMFQTWILRIADLTVVIDPCIGNDRTRLAFPYMDNLATPFLERFALLGVEPDQVDYVFCTHLHCDHCGWNTHLREGRWVPTFPNARYLFVAREAERWNPARPGYSAVDYNVGVFEDSILPIIDAGLADLVEDHHHIAPWLWIEPTHGHTVAHAMLGVDSGAGEIYFTGDAFHHPLQVFDSRLDLGGCDDLTGAIATRDRLLSRFADSQALMIPAHFSSPYCGTIERHGEGYSFKAIETNLPG